MGIRAGPASDIVWSLNARPVTLERPPSVDLDSFIKKPGVPRADSAPSKETPEPEPTHGQTVLEAHCSFFDTDGDGVVYPLDTFHGFHSIGFNWLLSLVAVFVIHGTFSYWTQESWVPDVRLPLHLKNIHRCKHGSDSATYDTEGRYIPERFEEIFTKYAKRHGDAISREELFAMICANRNILDPVGWTATTLEWGALWWVASDSEGLLSKERVRASYDGSLWYILAREQSEKRKRREAKAV